MPLSSNLTSHLTLQRFGELGEQVGRALPQTYPVVCLGDTSAMPCHTWPVSAFAKKGMPEHQ